MGSRGRRLKHDIAKLVITRTEEDEWDTEEKIRKEIAMKQRDNSLLKVNCAVALCKVLSARLLGTITMLETSQT